MTPTDSAYFSFRLPIQVDQQMKFKIFRYFLLFKKIETAYF